MAKVVIIGGGGHVGTYLVPRLVEAGHEVTNVSRGGTRPYQPHAAWGRWRRSCWTGRQRRLRGGLGRRLRRCSPMS